MCLEPRVLFYYKDSDTASYRESVQDMVQKWFCIAWRHATKSGHYQYFAKYTCPCNKVDRIQAWNCVDFVQTPPSQIIETYTIINKYIYIYYLIMPACLWTYVELKMFSQRCLSCKMSLQTANTGILYAITSFMKQSDSTPLEGLLKIKKK